MPRMTKSQLVDENIALRHNYDHLQQQFDKLQSQVKMPMSTSLNPQALTVAPDAPNYIDLEILAALRERGMPRFMQHGKEFPPSYKQYVYWCDRLGIDRSPRD